MPYKSEKQRKFLHAKKPKLAKEFYDKTAKYKDMLEKIGMTTLKKAQKKRK